MQVTDLLEQLGIPFKTSGHEHCRPGWVQVDCPWCSANWKHFRFGINNQSLRGNCYSCGPHNVTHALATAAGQPHHLVKSLLAGLGPTKPVESRTRGILKLPRGLGPLMPCHREYLESRGLDPDQAEQLWGVRGIGMQIRFKFRLWLPVMNRGGETLSWTTRSLGQTTNRRYISAGVGEEAYPHKDLLFGEQNAGPGIVVVEGPLDALAGGCGFVATMGTAYSRAQVARIAKFARRVICFDSEPTAQKRARQLCRDLAALPGETLRVELEGAKDVCEALKTSLSEIKELRRMLT